MAPLIRWNPPNALERRLRQEVEQRSQRINQSSNRATVAIQEGVHLHQMVASVIVTTLSLAQQEIETARRTGGLSTYQEQAIQAYREAYKAEVLASLEKAHTSVYRHLMKR